MVSEQQVSVSSTLQQELTRLLLCTGLELWQCKRERQARVKASMLEALKPASLDGKTTEEKVEIYKKEFMSYDTDYSGDLSWDELQRPKVPCSTQGGVQRRLPAFLGRTSTAHAGAVLAECSGLWASERRPGPPQAEREDRENHLKRRAVTGRTVA